MKHWIHTTRGVFFFLLQLSEQHKKCHTGPYGPVMHPELLLYCYSAVKPAIKPLAVIAGDTFHQIATGL